MKWLERVMFGLFIVACINAVVVVYAFATQPIASRCTTDTIAIRGDTTWTETMCVRSK